MPTGGEIKNIASLISNNEIFVVPDFQRNYAWDKKQVEDLFTDILEARDSGGDHFIGSLILQRANDGSVKKMLVVDGQQRLTTLFILISQIRDEAYKLSIDHIPDALNHGAPIQVTYQAHDILTVEGKPRFEAHPMIKAMAQSRILAFPSQDRPKLPTKHYKFTLKLRANTKRISELVRAQIADLADDTAKLLYLHTLLQTIKHKLKMLEVTADTTAEAYEIFMTLNSRGLPLGPSDLVKSEIFKHLTEGLVDHALETKSNSLSGEWKSIVDDLEQGDLDQFIRHFVVSTEAGSTTAKKVPDKISDRIRAGASKKVESERLLAELRQSAEVYGDLLDGEIAWLKDTEVSLKPKAKLSLQLLADLSDSYRIFLMVVSDLRFNLTKEQRVELIRLTEVISFRWVLAGLNAQKLEDLFQTLALGLRAGKPFESIVDEVTSSIPKDEFFGDVFKDVIESTTLVRTVLFRINRARWDESATLAYSRTSFHVEHIAPDKPTDGWMDKLFPADYSERDVEYDAATELWGNKTLLEWKINLKVKQRPFEEKRLGIDGRPPAGFDGYSKSKFNITSDLGSNVEDWDRDEIAMRNEWIADCFVKVFAVLDRSSEVVAYSHWKQLRAEG